MEEIIKEFDFDLVAKYEMLFSENPRTKDELISLAREIIIDLVTSKSVSCVSHNCFKAYYDADGNITLIRFEYILESSFSVFGGLV